MMTPAIVGDLSGFAPLVVQWILKALLLGTCAAALTWLVVHLFARSARPAVITAFWVIVLLRFVIPELPGTPVSLSGLLGLPAWAPTPASVATPPPGIDSQFSPGQFDFYFLLNPPTATSITAAAPRIATIPSGSRSFSLTLPFALLYVLTVSGLVVYRTRAYRQFARTSRGYPLADAQTQRMVCEICVLSGVRCIPQTHVRDTDRNAYVFGLLRPTLVLSRAHLASRDELRAVVLHEIAHLRRGDLLVRHIQWLVGTLLFFWPVVAWVNRRIDLAREHACDEWALRHSALSTTQYARCLLRAASGVKPRYAPFIPAAMASNLNHVERRIEMIFQSASRMRTSRWLGMTSGMTLLAWGGFVLSGGSATVSAKATNPEATTRGHMVSILAENGEPATCEKRIVVRRVGDTTAAMAGTATGASSAELDDNTVVMTAVDASPDGTETRKCVVKISREIDAETLAKFRESHPGADANGNGQLTTAEHNAYLAALALRDGAAVIAQFPKADLNNDGRLDTDEAVRLATLGLPFEMKCDLAPGGVPSAINIGAVAEADAEGRRAVIVKSIATTVDNDGEVRIGSATDDADGRVCIIARRVESDDPTITGTAVELNINGEDVLVPAVAHDVETTTQNGNRRIMVRTTARLQDKDGNAVDCTKDGLIAAPVMIAISPDMAELPMIHGPRVVAEWLIENITARPTEEEVAALVDRVERLPFDLFLKSHPDADTDHDGVLTSEEREAYLQNMIGDIRMTGRVETADKLRILAVPAVAMRGGADGLPPQALLKKFPHADTDGDGKLSPEEFNACILSLIETQGQADENQPNRRVFIFRDHGTTIRGSKMENGDQREVEIRVEQLDETRKE